MPFTGEQVNTFGPRPSRRFLMDATRGGLPVDVLHVYQEATATMRVDLCSLVPMVNAGGPELDRAETVTVFNDLCLLAPSALVGAPIAWRSIDAHRTEGTFTNGPLTVRAELVFDQDHQLVDFVSDDRFRAGTDGRPSRPEQWSTPIRGRGTVDGTQVVTDGDGRWRGPEGDFTYLEFHLDEIAYDVTTPGAVELVRPERVVPSSVMLGDGSAATTGLRP
ncbi:DUF6544 family protein [Microlunatus aurantiacus]